MKVHCWLVTGDNLNEEILDILFFTARDMMRENKRQRKFQKEGNHYDIRTKFESSSVGGTNGILFDATVYTLIGKSDVRYSVRVFDALNEKESNSFLQKLASEGKGGWARRKRAMVRRRSRQNYTPSEN